MKAILTLLIFTIVAVSAGEDSKNDDTIFQLITVSPNSDLDTSLLKKIIDTGSGEEIDENIKKLFKPVKAFAST